MKNFRAVLFALLALAGVVSTTGCWLKQPCTVTDTGKLVGALSLNASGKAEDLNLSGGGKVHLEREMICKESGERATPEQVAAARKAASTAQAEEGSPESTPAISAEGGGTRGAE